MFEKTLSKLKNLIDKYEPKLKSLDKFTHKLAITSETQSPSYFLVTNLKKIKENFSAIDDFLYNKEKLIDLNSISHLINKTAEIQDILKAHFPLNEKDTLSEDAHNILVEIAASITVVKTIFQKDSTATINAILYKAKKHAAFAKNVLFSNMAKLFSLQQINEILYTNLTTPENEELFYQYCYEKFYKENFQEIAKKCFLEISELFLARKDAVVSDTIELKNSLIVLKKLNVFDDEIKNKLFQLYITGTIKKNEVLSSIASKSNSQEITNYIKKECNNIGNIIELIDLASRRKSCFEVIYPLLYKHAEENANFATLIFNSPLNMSLSLQEKTNLIYKHFNEEIPNYNSSIDHININNTLFSNEKNSNLIFGTLIYSILNPWERMNLIITCNLFNIDINNFEDPSSIFINYDDILKILESNLDNKQENYYPNKIYIPILNKAKSALISYTDKMIRANLEAERKKNKGANILDENIKELRTMITEHFITDPIIINIIIQIMQSAETLKRFLDKIKMPIANLKEIIDVSNIMLQLIKKTKIANDSFTETENEHRENLNLILIFLENKINIIKQDFTPKTYQENLTEISLKFQDLYTNITEKQSSPDETNFIQDIINAINGLVSSISNKNITTDTIEEIFNKIINKNNTSIPNLLKNYDFYQILDDLKKQLISIKNNIDNPNFHDPYWQKGQFLYEKTLNYPDFMEDIFNSNLQNFLYIEHFISILNKTIDTNYNNYNYNIFRDLSATLINIEYKQIYSKNPNNSKSSDNLIELLRIIDKIQLNDVIETNALLYILASKTIKDYDLMQNLVYDNSIKLFRYADISFDNFKEMADRYILPLMKIDHQILLIEKYGTNDEKAMEETKNLLKTFLQRDFDSVNYNIIFSIINSTFSFAYGFEEKIPFIIKLCEDDEFIKKAEKNKKLDWQILMNVSKRLVLEDPIYDNFKKFIDNFSSTNTDTLLFGQDFYERTAWERINIIKALTTFGLTINELTLSTNINTIYQQKLTELMDNSPGKQVDSIRFLNPKADLTNAFNTLSRIIPSVSSLVLTTSESEYENDKPNMSEFKS